MTTIVVIIFMVVAIVAAMAAAMAVAITAVRFRSRFPCYRDWLDGYIKDYAHPPG
jgi:hypothetical protein